ncbi:MAG TPA: pilus assembly protein TadG-related protein [Candidatus Acidoferrum sp.]|nr:pilus assembly protein TadG-related protein [Candidatus Acidoferrum sp.]
MRRNRQAGQALYLTAMSLIVVVGLLGFGIDMGTLRYEKRLQQTAADAAAIAGANDLQYGGAAGVSIAAQNAASSNGFNGAGDGDVTDCGAGAAIGTVCVQVDSAGTTGGPLSGPHTGNPNYVEVLVAAVQPTYFMRIFGVRQETVTARAVATNVSSGPNTPCLLALNTSASALSINGTVNVSLCSIIANGEIQINGRVSGATSIGAGECGGTCANVITGISAMADPIASLPTPPANGCQPSGGLVGLLLNFCNGTVAAGVNLPLNDPSGLYIVSAASGLTLGAGATLYAPGETLYIPNGINFTPGANISVTAAAIIVGQPLNLGGNVTLTLGGGNSTVKNAVLVE